MTDRIAFPDMRREVMVALDHLADREYQQRVWRDRELPGEGGYYSWDMAVHALYDDAPLGAKVAIGSLLRDETEAGAIDDLIAAIEAVFAELGDPDAPVSEVLEARGWPAVLQAARRAADLLRR
jgi:hypothetical protein